MVATNENPLIDVPKLKYQSIMKGTCQDDILNAMSEYGFFYIIDIPGFDSHAELDTMKAFFNWPQETKEKYASMKHNSNNKNVLRGYGLTRNSEGAPMEEVFNIGQYEARNITIQDVQSRAEYISREPNIWPENANDLEGSKDFKSVLQNGFKIRMELANKLVDEVAAAMDYNEFVEKFAEGEFTSFYLKKYIAREAKDNTEIYKADSGYSMVSEDGRDLSMPSHIDTTMTLLATYSNGGLQAWYKNAWYDVPAVMNSIMMMTGSLIEELTDNKLPSLRHRVIDIKGDRYSTPFFFNPSFHANISKSLSGKETETGKESKTFGPWQVVQLHRDEPLLLNPTSLD
uniref:Putative isopenicillin-n-synthase n=1 Tax=Bathyctena chuni TaxID=1403704 RepID=A0A0A0RW12_BATCU|nr:putative isopenicillin-n-synthase [Bathyctena chuni]